MELIKSIAGVAMLTGILLFFNVSLKALKVMLALIAVGIGVPLLIGGARWFSLLIVLGLCAFVTVPWFLAELIRRMFKRLKKGKKEVEETEAVAVEPPEPDINNAESECVDSNNAPQNFLCRDIPVATSILIAANVAAMIFLCVKTGSIDPKIQAYIEYGADFRPLTFGGQWWRTVTSAFIHFGPVHLLMNMVCLFSIGRTLEKLLGRINVVLVYFFTAIFGGLFSCLFHADTVCAGASGAVFGFFGAELAYVLLLRNEFNLDSRETSTYLQSSLTFTAINLLYSLKPGVDMAGHFGGLLAGLALGAIFANAVKRGCSAFNKTKWAMSGVAIIISCLLAFSAHTGRNANIEILRQEVSNLFIEKTSEAIRSKGAKNVSIAVEDLSLSRVDGNSYKGRIAGTAQYDGEREDFSFGIKVVYDYETISFELEGVE